MYEKEVVKHGEPVEESVQYQLNLAKEALVTIMASSWKSLSTENNRSQPLI